MTKELSPRHTVQNRRWGKALSLSLLLAFLLLGPLLGLHATPAAADGWVIECVDCPKQFSEMTDRSLRLDAEGHPHIAYGKEHLYHAWHDGVSWHYETADDSPGVGRYTSLALDESGYPHISCYGDGLKCAHRDASGWHVETVDSDGDAGLYTSLALDGDGYPHISYNESGFRRPSFLKYAYQDASGWHVETVEYDGDAGLYTSLALDGDGYPHISYYHILNRDLNYAYQDASGWHVQTVDSEEDVGSYTSLALDADGYPHISYGGTGDLKYAYQDTSGWHIETVDSGGQYTSLVLDGADYPHISYYDDTNGDLKYAYYSAWKLYLPLIRKVVSTPTPAPTPTPTQPRITDIRMSDAPGGPETTWFPSGTSVVYAVFDYSDLQNGKFMIRVYDNVGNVLLEHVKVYTGSGTESIEVAGPEGEAFPDGRYITILYMGLFPTKTIIWEVGEISKSFSPFITPAPTPLPTLTPTTIK